MSNKTRIYIKAHTNAFVLQFFITEMHRFLVNICCLSIMVIALAEGDGSCDWVVEAVTYFHPSDASCQGQGYLGSCKGICPSSATPRTYDTKYGIFKSLYEFLYYHSLSHRESLQEATNPFETDCKCCQSTLQTCDSIPVDMTCPNGTVFRAVKVFQCTALTCGCSTCKP